MSGEHEWDTTRSVGHNPASSRFGGAVSAGAARARADITRLPGTRRNHPPVSGEATSAPAAAPAKVSSMGTNMVTLSARDITPARAPMPARELSGPVVLGAIAAVVAVDRVASWLSRGVPSGGAGLSLVRFHRRRTVRTEVAA